MAELRQEPRLQEEMDVTVVFKAGPETRQLEGKVFCAHSVDISASGLQLDSDTPFPVGAQVELNIMFRHTDASFWQTGYVVWDVKPVPASPGEKTMHRIGIQFNAEDNTQPYAWNTLVTELYQRHRVLRPH